MTPAFKPHLTGNRSRFFRLPDFSKKPVFNFISKRSGPFDGAVTLTRDRVYIVPTKFGLIFSVLLLTLLIGSINYEKNLGFILTFLLVGLGNIFLLSTWRNLAGLDLRADNATAVFAGETASYSVQLINRQLLDRYSIVISHNGIDHDTVDCKANSQQQINFDVLTKKRGILDAGRFRLYTEFPSGLFIVWTWIDLSMSCTVYPAPDTDTEMALYDNSQSGDNEHQGAGVEHFSHLRKFHHGDKINRISWKAAAKNDELFTKEFIGAMPVSQWINWHEIPANDTEKRLSIMTSLIINAENNNQHYGLILPQLQIPLGHGAKHYHQCLTALALF